MQLPLARQFEAWLGDRLVLVIDPSVNYRSSIKRFLTNLRVKRMKFVSSVAEARRELLTSKVGLFIAEWQLDGENGLQFCRSVRKEHAYKGVPFLLLSVENLRNDVILAAEIQIDGYLLKPFSYEDFCAQIETLLRTQTQPSRVTTLIELAEERLAKGDAETAEKLFGEALIERPNSARALCGIARMKRLRGDLEGALRSLREALKHNGEFMEAYREMLGVAEDREDRAGIIQAATVLHGQSPENPRYTLVLARAYLELDELAPSLQFYKKTVTLSPRMAEAYKGLGCVYFAKEEYEKAQKNFKRALDLDENDTSLLNSLALAHVRLGQFKEGIDRYLMALKLDANDPRVLFNLGHAYEKRGEGGDLEKAKWYYAQALIHQPGFEKAQRGLDRVEKLAAGDSGAA